MTKYLAIGVAYGFAAAVQPGQLQAYLVAQTMTSGGRRTLPVACAPIVSDVPVVCLVLVVLTRLPLLRLLSLVQIVGGLFLLYLAYGAAGAARHYGAAVTAPAPARLTFLRAVLINLLNPNPYLAWMFVLGPLLLSAWRDAPASGIALVAGFYLTMVAGNAALVLLLAAARTIGSRVARALLVMSAVGLAIFGAYELWSGLLGRAA